MKHRFHPKYAFAALALSLACAAPVTAHADDTDRFATALQLHRDGRWAAAYGRFATLADQGHADAARIAMFMLRYGPELYNTAWSAAPSQIEQWERVGGSPASIQLVYGD